jgi:ribosomal protein L20A (L18A)
MKIFQDYKKAIIYHELGHWILAREFNLNAGDIKIKLYPMSMSIGYYGSAEISPQPSINNLDELSNYLKNRIAVLLGGVLSELLLEENQTQETFNKLTKENGEDDNRKIVELLYIYSGISSNNKVENRKEQIKKIHQECHDYTFNKIKNNKDIIEYLANKLSDIIKKNGQEYPFSKEQLETWVDEYRVNQ